VGEEGRRLVRRVEELLYTGERGRETDWAHRFSGTPSRTRVRAHSWAMGCSTGSPAGGGEDVGLEASLGDWSETCE
jgi:hypothetical protein